jgi:hypothetical protein
LPLLGVPKLDEIAEVGLADGVPVGTIRKLILSPAFRATLELLVHVVAVSAIVQVFALAAWAPPAGVTITVNA